MIKNFEAYFFDLDGVLFDSCDWHYESLNKSLYEVCNTIISREDHLEKYNGLPTKVKLKKLQIDEEKIPYIVSLKNEYFLKFAEYNCKPDEQKIELLKYLKHNKRKVVCVTNCIRNTVELILDKLGIIQYFDLLVSNEDVIANKPDPYPYDFACNFLKSDGSHCLAIEDSPVGIMAASKSVISVVWKVKNSTEVNLTNYTNIFGEIRA